MDASQYKDYVLVLLFIEYVSDKYAGPPFAPIIIPEGASFKDMVALKGKSDIGDQINKRIIGPLAAANKLSDMPDFNDAAKAWYRQWGTMQRVLSSRSRMDQVGSDLGVAAEIVNVFQLAFRRFHRLAQQGERLDRMVEAPFPFLQSILQQHLGRCSTTSRGSRQRSAGRIASQKTNRNTPHPLILFFTWRSRSTKP